MAAANRRAAPATLDVVIPMYNESAGLPALLKALAESFSSEARERHGISRVRCLFVDDGSTDSSVKLLRDSRVPGLEITVIRLSRNFGHQAAVTAGIANSSADVVAVIDADLQDPPSCILEMVEKWREGFEVIHAQRRSRQEGLAKRLLSKAFYRIYRLLSPVDVPVDSGDFCLIGRRVVEELNRLPETLRFPRGLRSWVGFPQATVQYDRPARAVGGSRYGWGDLYQLATDGIASLSIRPLQLAQVLAIVYFVLALTAVAALLFDVFDGIEPRAQLTLLMVLVLLSNALIMFCIYILGAYVGRAYWEVKGRPTYVVAEILEPEGGERP